MAKQIVCRNCGSPMDSRAKACPKCGAPNRKPLHKRGWFRVLVVLLILGIVGAVGSGDGKDKDKKENITWSTLALGDILPEPASTVGEVNLDSDSSLMVDLSDWTENGFREYLTACQEAGFDVDASRSTRWFSADNPEGYHLSLSYTESSKELSISLSAPSKQLPPAESSAGSQNAGTEEPASSGSGSVPEPPASSSAPSASSSAPSASSLQPDPQPDGMRPDFVAAMDSYEAFYDEYVAFMKKYAENPSDLTLLADYASFMSRLTEMDEAFDQWEDQDLSAEELAYYVEVNARIQQKLLEVAGATG